MAVNFMHALFDVIGRNSRVLKCRFGILHPSQEAGGKLSGMVFYKADEAIKGHHGDLLLLVPVSVSTKKQSMMSATKGCDYNHNYLTYSGKFQLERLYGFLHLRL